MYNIKFDDNIDSDLDQLSDELLFEALKYFELFKKEYEKYSLPLYDMNGRNLKGCRKTYFGNSEYRIVSKLEGGVVNIVNIISVGKREAMDVYRKAHLRIIH